MNFKKKYFKYKYKYVNSKFNAGGIEKLKLEHKGNSWTDLKYAMHCIDDTVYTNTVNLLLKIGFTIIHQEKDQDKHTFLYPPESFGLLPGTFMFILIIKNDGNNNKLISGQAQMGPHIGFRVNKSVLEDLIIKMNDEKIMIVKKPDETTLAVELPCGEILEFSG